MFKDLFLTQTKITLRNRQGLFWTIVFPFVMGTLFFFAFRNLITNEIFTLDPIPVAVIDNTASSDYGSFQSFMESVGVKGEEGEKVLEPVEEGTDPLFYYKQTNKEEAERLMEQGKVFGTIENGDPIKFILAPSEDPGFKAGIIESVLNQHQQNFKSIRTIMEKKSQEGDLDPNFLEESIRLLNQRQSPAIKDVTPNKLSSPYIILFFSLLGYSALLAMTSSIFYVSSELEADLSHIALRQGISPVPKFIRFIAGALPRLLLQMIASLLLFLYLKILGIDFGDQTLAIILLIEAGCAAGFFIGSGIATTFRKSEKILSALAIGLPLLFASLSGMMSPVVLTYANKYVPFLQRVNPIIKITDGIYSLYYYEGYSRYLRNLGELALLAAVFLGITIFNLRRKQYENI